MPPYTSREPFVTSPPARGSPMPQRSTRFRQTRTPGGRLWLDALEDRTLLSAAPLLDRSGLQVIPPSSDPSHVLVQFRSQPAVRSVLPGTRVGQAVDAPTLLYQVDLAPSVSVAQALAAYRADVADVVFAEPDYTLRASAVPNDPRFGEQWALRNTGQAGGKPGADLGATLAWNVSHDAHGVVVAVIDTGIDYTHPDLDLNIWINQKEIPASRRANLLDVN